MKRGTILGAASGLIAGVSLTALALAAPSYAFFNGPTGAAAQVATAPVVQQLAAPLAAQQARYGTVNNLADLVAKVSPSVVKIEVRSAAPRGQGGNPLAGTPFEGFERFFGAPAVPGQQNPGEQRDMRGSGSGFVIQGGYVVTNNHVVDGARRMTVILEDGRQLNATLVGADERTDLAVVKVEGSNLPPALQWGDSKRARPGDNVFAMGAPFGLGNTVTAGIVSARGRSLGETYGDFIQVDAPINRGNSGGPLFDQTGQVIGVNSAIFSPTGGNVGIGFSIPSDLAQNIVSQIIQTGSVSRGWLGVGITTLDIDQASALGIPAKGALVGNVVADSPASRAGLKEQDVIIAFGDREIAQSTDLTRAVAETKAGTTKDVRILRGGREQTIKVRIDALKDDEAKLASVDPSASPSRTGATASASVSVADLGLTLGHNGTAVVVTDVKINSPADDAQIQQGDRILMVGQTEVKTADAAKKAIEDAKKQNRKAVMLQVETNRGGTPQKFFAGVPFSEG